MSKEKKPKAQKNEEKVDNTFSDLISKITVTKNTPHGFLSDLQEKFGIDNCQVVVKLEDENKCIVFTHPQANQSEDIYGVMIDHLVTTKHMKNDSFWS